MRHLYSLYTSRSGSLPPVSPAAILHDDHILPYLPSMNYMYFLRAHSKRLEDLSPSTVRYPCDSYSAWHYSASGTPCMNDSALCPE